MTEDLVKGMLSRLAMIEISNQWEQSWVSQIMKHNLEFEVAACSGLTEQLIDTIDDESFINMVSNGMSEWDI